MTSLSRPVASLLQCVSDPGLGLEPRLAGIRRALAQGADVNAKITRRGSSALHLAARTRQPEVARLLLDKGANVNQKDDFDGSTPLMIAVADLDGEVDMALVALLLHRGADVNQRSNDGGTALVMARTGNLRLMTMLVDAGADVNVKDVNGFTPLGLAEINGSVETVKLLLAHGAKPLSKGKGEVDPNCSFEVMRKGQKGLKNLLNAGDIAEASSIVKQHKQGLLACNACAASGADVKLRVCNTCKQVRYCGKECQRRDWAAHKHACSALKAAAAAAVQGGPNASQQQ